jgi:hypothetical protein
LLSLDEYAYMGISFGSPSQLEGGARLRDGAAGDAASYRFHNDQRLYYRCIDDKHQGRSQVSLALAADRRGYGRPHPIISVEVGDRGLRVADLVGLARQE